MSVIAVRSGCEKCCDCSECCCSAADHLGRACRRVTAGATATWLLVATSASTTLHWNSSPPLPSQGDTALSCSSRLRQRAAKSAGCRRMQRQVVKTSAPHHKANRCCCHSPRLLLAVCFAVQRPHYVNLYCSYDRQSGGSQQSTACVACVHPSAPTSTLAKDIAAATCTGQSAVDCSE